MALACANLFMTNVFLYSLIFVLFHAGLYVLVSIFKGTFKIGGTHALFIGLSAALFVILVILDASIQYMLWASGY